MVDGHGDLVLRPAPWSWYQKRLVGLLAVAAVASVAVAAVGVSEGDVVGAAVVLAIPVVGVLLAWGSLRNSRIVVTPHEIAVLGLAFRRRVPRTGGVSVVRARVLQVRGPALDTVYVLDASGRVVIRINGLNYASAEIDRLVRFLGLPSSGPDAPVTAPQLAGMYPSVVSWHEAHPAKVGLLGTVVVAVIVVVITLLVLLV